MRYILQKSAGDPLWWVVTDTETQLVCRFREGDFNGSQKYTLLDDIKLTEADAPRLAAAANGIAQWLRDNHCELLFASTPEVRQATRKRVGRIINEARESRGLSLRALSDMSGIDKNQISRIEAGRLNATLDTITALATALGLTLDLHE